MDKKQKIKNSFVTAAFGALMLMNLGMFLHLAETPIWGKSYKGVLLFGFGYFVLDFLMHYYGKLHSFKERQNFKRIYILLSILTISFISMVLYTELKS